MKFSTLNITSLVALEFLRDGASRQASKSPLRRPSISILVTMLESSAVRSAQNLATLRLPCNNTQPSSRQPRSKLAVVSALQHLNSFSLNPIRALHASLCGVGAATTVLLACGDALADGEKVAEFATSGALQLGSQFPKQPAATRELRRLSTTTLHPARRRFCPVAILLWKCLSCRGLGTLPCLAGITERALLVVPSSQAFFPSPGCSATPCK